MNGEEYMRILESLEAVGKEVVRATEVHGPFNTNHEGFAVIYEELDELWDEIKKKQASKQKLFVEAMQVGAMAVRFMVDLCFEDQEEIPTSPKLTVKEVEETHDI